jgi:hypothetical protein
MYFQVRLGCTGTTDLKKSVFITLMSYVIAEFISYVISPTFPSAK